MTSESTLIEIKKRIDQAIIDKARAEGQLDEVLHTLKDEYNCNSIDEATIFLNALKENVELVTTEVTSEVASLKKVFGI